MNTPQDSERDKAMALLQLRNLSPRQSSYHLFEALRWAMAELESKEELLGECVLDLLKTRKLYTR